MNFYEEDVAAYLNKPGFCPWCGAEISPLDISLQAKEIDWMFCRTLRCRGTYVPVVTDLFGFVATPHSVKGRYIYARDMSKWK
jgi:hypothetical protein